MKTDLLTKKRICILISLALIFIMAGCGKYGAVRYHHPRLSNLVVHRPDYRKLVFGAV